MAIQLVYLVRNKAEEIVREFINKKAAAAFDKKLEIIDELNNRLREAMPSASDEERAALVAYLIEDREQIAELIKGIKDLPEDVAEGASSVADGVSDLNEGVDPAPQADGNEHPVVADTPPLVEVPQSPAADNLQSVA